MTVPKALERITREETRLELMRETSERLGRELEQEKRRKEVYARTTGIFTELSDGEMSSFCGAIEETANAAISEVFPDGYSITLEPSGKTGINIEVNEAGGLKDTVFGSQGQGFSAIVSLSLLLSAVSLSPVVTPRFLCMDEPLPGMATTRLQCLYRWFRSTCEELGLQVIITSHHEEAAEHSNHVIEIRR